LLPRTRQTFLKGYLPILADAFYAARRAKGQSTGAIKYCREKLNIFPAWCEVQAVTQIEQVTPDLLHRFLLVMGETITPEA